MAYFRSDKITGGQIRLGGTTYTLQEIRYGAQKRLVWPVSQVYTYAILTNTIQVLYSGGRNDIAASASNYAYMTADVEEYLNGTYVRTIWAARLTMNLISEGGTAATETAHFILTNNEIHGKNLDATNKGMGTQSFPNGLTVDVTSYGYGGTTVTTLPKTVTQQANTSQVTGHNYVYKDFWIWTNTDTLDPAATSFHAIGRYQYDDTPLLTWTSGASSAGTTQYDLYSDTVANILSVTSDPAVSGISWSGTVVTVPANTGADDRTYTVRANWTDPNGYTWPAAEAEVEHSAVAKTYGAPYDFALTYRTALACADEIEPVLSFKQNWTRGSQSGTVTVDDYNPSSGWGTLTDGTSFQATFGGTTAHGATLGQYGKVTVPSRGTTPGLEWTVVSGVRVSVSANGQSATSPSGVSVIQKANEPTTIAAHRENVQAAITGFKIGNNTVTSIPDFNPTIVSVLFSASWTQVAAETFYTAYYDGDTSAHTGGGTSPGSTTTISSLEVDGVTQAQATNFSADNRYSDQQHTYAVRAYLDSDYYGEAPIPQAADSKHQVYSVSLAVVADGITRHPGGGIATLRATASYTYAWTDGTPTSDGPVPVTPSFSGGGTRYHITSNTVSDNVRTVTITHDDMAKNEATDSVTFTASAGGVSDTQSFSVTNERDSEPTEAYGSWYDSSPLETSTRSTRYHVTLSSSLYTDSSAPADPTSGTYNILSYDAYHFEEHVKKQYRDLIRTWYYSSYYDGSVNSYDQTTTQKVDSKWVPTGEADTKVYDTPVITTDKTWLTVSGTSVHFDAQQSGGMARAGVITATNGDADDSVTLYQRGYSEVALSTNTLAFGWQGGTQYVTAIARYTPWAATTTGGAGVSPTAYNDSDALEKIATQTLSVTMPPNETSQAVVAGVVITPTYGVKQRIQITQEAKEQPT